MSLILVAAPSTESLRMHVWGTYKDEKGRGLASKRIVVTAVETCPPVDAPMAIWVRYLERKEFEPEQAVMVGEFTTKGDGKFDGHILLPAFGFWNLQAECKPYALPEEAYGP
jgi:hypothetical protein